MENMIKRENMKVKQEESKVKPKIVMLEDTDFRTMDTNIIVKKLEENMKLREMSVEKRFKKEIMK